MDFHALIIRAGGRTYMSTRRIHRGLIEDARRVALEAGAGGPRPSP